MDDENTENKSLLLVFTGNGKGKTTSALGLAFRAIGHGLPVCMVQFIKGNWRYGELEAAKQFAHLLDVHVMGRGFTWQSDDLRKDIEAARAAWHFAVKIIEEGRYHLLILDELTYLVTYGMIDEQTVLRGLAARPDTMHVVVTGRGATSGLIEAADLVTEMRDVKHHYAAGIMARKGIEF
ncbi:MAG TPA: cob(I)yrinic acid a,c-diamide adenosyltransferase [Desulfobacteraceae bacterium]|nr:cob(I)yrinic acid a,c-diamide adenosyltransferase [Desulfobacteraceae bacterium]